MFCFSLFKTYPSITISLLDYSGKNRIYIQTPITIKPNALEILTFVFCVKDCIPYDTLLPCVMLSAIFELDIIVYCSLSLSSSMVYSKLSRG